LFHEILYIPVHENARGGDGAFAGPGVFRPYLVRQDNPKEDRSMTALTTTIAAILSLAILSSVISQVVAPMVI